MNKGKTVLGVIPARGGSKGIPRKNIQMLLGKPLIAYTIQAAQKSKYLARCIVSTEDPEIAAIATSHGAEVPFTRPQELARDESTTMQVLQHALRWLAEHEGQRYDYVLVLQPTSPLRVTEDIDACIRKIVETDADSVMSMMELPDFSLEKLKRIENDRIVPLFKEEGSQSSRRGDGSHVYKRNTAIYLTKTELIMQGKLFGDVSRPYVMPRERSIDVNEPVDLALTEFFLTRRRAA